MRRRSASSVLILNAALLCAVPGVAHESYKHVLIVHSFGRGFEPYAEVASSFQAELARLSPSPVEFFEASVEAIRHTELENEAPLVQYLNGLISEQGMDLVVSMGGPAAQFCFRHREDLLSSTPLLAAAVDTRWVTEVPSPRNTTAVPVVLDPARAIENILRVLPKTKEIYVVLGASPLGKLWLVETQREFQRFSDRVRFTWTTEWSLEELEKRVAHLPPRTAIFFGELSIDAAGIPYPRNRGLDALRAVANAPLFGLFESQLGRGVVGGPLLSLSDVGKQAAETALLVLDGESGAAIATPPLAANVVAFDFRELKKWGIRESLLPEGSVVQFRPPSFWEEYQRPLAIGFAVVAFQMALIGGLLLQRSRRQNAEEEARALARRLLTAHEDERSRLARELHDDLSQRLARLSIDAARVERSLPGSPEKESARNMRSDLARLSEDVHSLAYQLHPSVLDDLGLNEALNVECEQFSRRESIPARLTSFEAPSELPLDVSICLFRIAQEALRNVARHSRAHGVNLSVRATNGDVRMTVTDDGIGFVPAQARARSLGHASMRERARLLGGSLDVESALGRGTTVAVTVPLGRVSS